MVIVNSGNYSILISNSFAISGETINVQKNRNTFFSQKIATTGTIMIFAILIEVVFIVYTNYDFFNALINFCITYFKNIQEASFSKNMTMSIK